MTAPSVLDWSDIDGLPEVVSALGGGDHVRLVGGCVRDRLLGLPIGDVDLATTHPPDIVIARLKAAGLRAIPTGIDHGTVTALSSDRSFEITTLRRDLSTDGRHAIVKYSDDWAEDAARRDFTINALYSTPDSGQVFDYVGGLSDIDGPVIRFIGDAARRIAEDHLRILRYFRFMARFGIQDADADALEACRKARASLMTLSRERVTSELMRLLAAQDPSTAVAQMASIDLFGSFLPEVEAHPGERVAALVGQEKLAGTVPRPERRFALLLPVDDKMLEKLSARLKLSNRVRRTLVDIAHARLALEELSPRGLAYRYGGQAAVDALVIEAALNGQDKRSALAELDDWTVPELPVKGGALIRRGLAAGPLVSRALGQIEAQWIAEGFPTDREFESIVTDVITPLLESDQ